MSKPGFSMGFKPKSLPPKGSTKPKPKQPSRAAAFGTPNDASSSEDESSPSAFASKSKPTNGHQTRKPKKSPSPEAVAITEFDLSPPTALPPPSPPKPKPSSRKSEPPSRKPILKFPQPGAASLTSSLPPTTTEPTDSSIYAYDSVYETLKSKPPRPPSPTTSTGAKSSRYLPSLLASSTVRARDRQLAEEKKLARERAAEGDLYADKETFVTSAYKRQRAENARLAAEEQAREARDAAESRGAGGGGMSALYRRLLDDDEKRHAEIVRAVEQAAVNPNPDPEPDAQEDKEEKEEPTDAKLAERINAPGGSVLLNADGEVVDKRELLRGGLNLSSSSRKKAEQRHASTHRPSSGGGPSSRGTGARQAHRERQSRMLEQQLAAQLKRSLDRTREEEAELQNRVKSRKTDSDISSARERYLARKKAAEEAKAKGGE